MRKWVATFLSCALLLSLGFEANAAVKPGTTCKKLGTTSTFSGKKYTCIKSGRKLVWNKGIPVTPISSQAPTNVPTPVPSSSQIPQEKIAVLDQLTYELPSEVGDNIELCKIRELNLNGPRNGKAWDAPDAPAISLPSGFPRVTPATQHLGNVTWALIPIDFPDLVGEPNFTNRVDLQMKTLSDWYATVSDKKFKVEWRVSSKWVRLPNMSSNYAINQSMNLTNSEVGQKLFKDALSASDPTFDFTNIQQVIFVLPKGQTFLKESSQGFPWDKVVKEFRTQEGFVSGYSIAGTIFDQPGSEYWSYWAHEFGHSISLAHVGVSRGEMPPFNPWDLMGGQDGPSKELSGWLRFLAGWLPENQIYCKNIASTSEIKMTLIPLSSGGDGLKLAIFPLPSGKALLIESRRVTSFSCTTATKRDGVLAYVYNPNLGHGEDFLVPLPPIERIKEPSECNGSLVYGGGPKTSDVLLHKGDKVSIEGISVEVLAHGNFDKVVVTKR